MEFRDVEQDKKKKKDKKTFLTVSVSLNDCLEIRCKNLIECVWDVDSWVCEIVLENGF